MLIIRRFKSLLKRLAFICIKIKWDFDMEKYEKLSLCGLYCSVCKNYKENYNFIGCSNEKELVNECPYSSMLHG
jgi:hypothetical protein